MMEEGQMMVETASTAASANTTATATNTTAASAFVATAAATATPVVEGSSTTSAGDQERCSGHDCQNQRLTKHQGISLHFGTL